MTIRSSLRLIADLPARQVDTAQAFAHVQRLAQDTLAVEQLKDCPCCRSPALIDGPLGAPSGYSVRCQGPDCGLRTPVLYPADGPVHDRLVALWNRRD